LWLSWGNCGGSLGRTNFATAWALIYQPDSGPGTIYSLSLSLPPSRCSTMYHTGINPTTRALTCTSERRQNGEGRHDEIAENVAAPHPSVGFLSAVVYLVARCRQPAREPRSHNNKRTAVRLFKGRPPRVSPTLSLSLSRSRRVVAAAVCRRCPSPAVVGEARSRPRGAPTSRRFNAQRTRVSRRRITTFVGRPPPLLTDKCHAARRGTRSIICY